MDNPDGDRLGGSEDLDKPIPLDDDLDRPIPFDDNDTGQTNVSHSPLNLGGSGAAEVPKPTAARPAVARPAVARPATARPSEQAVSTDRITGVKTFFTKLHPGAMDFLDGQINSWLKANPGIVIKRTNIATGEVQAKKTEPNIIITVWY
jgi:hypothetical protein